MYSLAGKFTALTPEAVTVFEGDVLDVGAHVFQEAADVAPLAQGGPGSGGDGIATVIELGIAPADEGEPLEDAHLSALPGQPGGGHQPP
jgi:hypothetical protein